MANTESNGATTRRKTNRPAPDASKFGLVASMLRRPGGASIIAIIEATGWQRTSARGRISADIPKLLKDDEVIERRRYDGISHYAVVKVK